MNHGTDSRKDKLLVAAPLVLALTLVLSFLLPTGLQPWRDPAVLVYSVTGTAAVSVMAAIYSTARLWKKPKRANSMIMLVASWAASLLLAALSFELIWRTRYGILI
jgi:hypothetical protein